ncbi:MAG: glycosyltransferase [Desulfoferrobacter sp.]
MQAFSLNDALIKDIFHHAKPLGHHENPRNLNLGFGFLYYGSVRALRPKHTLVISSGYGFTVVCLALGIKDNGSGKLTFVDPSYSQLRDGPYMQEELKGTPTVFTGYLQGEDLAAIYASSDLFVFPSTTDTFGNVVLEAQASGLPVIVTDCGGPPRRI